VSGDLGQPAYVGGRVYWAPAGTDPERLEGWTYLGELAPPGVRWSAEGRVCGECGSWPCASTCPAQDES
jgi:hypothetical protein